jgi:hypothetical protein
VKIEFRETTFDLDAEVFGHRDYAVVGSASSFSFDHVTIRHDLLAKQVTINWGIRGNASADDAERLGQRLIAAAEFGRELLKGGAE